LNTISDWDDPTYKLFNIDGIQNLCVGEFLFCIILSIFFFQGIFKIWSTRRAWPFLAGRWILQSYLWIYDKIYIYVPKFDYWNNITKLWSIYSSNLPHFKSAKKCVFDKEWLQNFLHAKSVWIIHKTWYNIFGLFCSIFFNKFLVGASQKKTPRLKLFGIQNTSTCTILGHFNKLYHGCGHDIAYFVWKSWNENFNFSALIVDGNFKKQFSHSSKVPNSSTVIWEHVFFHGARKRYYMPNEQSSILIFNGNF
jgi:hypothetical protein